MNTSTQSPTPLSKKRYAIARIIKYIQLLIIVALLFVPIFQITSYDPDYKLTTKASISTFDFLIGDTSSSVKISGSGNKDADSFLNSLASASSVDVVYEVLSISDEGFLIALRISSIVIGLFAATITLLTGRTNNKSMHVKK